MDCLTRIYGDLHIISRVCISYGAREHMFCDGERDSAIQKAPPLGRTPAKVSGDRKHVCENVTEIALCAIAASEHDPAVLAKASEMRVDSLTEAVGVIGCCALTSATAAILNVALLHGPRFLAKQRRLRCVSPVRVGGCYRGELTPRASGKATIVDQVKFVSESFCHFLPAN